jgi:hypothetical protein
MLRYAFAVTVVVVGAHDFKEKAEQCRAGQSGSATPIPHLIVLPPLQYSQIIPIYPPIFVSCLGMLLLAWLWWLLLPTERRKSGAGQSDLVALF